MALESGTAQKLVKYILEGSPNQSASIEGIKGCGVTNEEIVRCALDHPALKPRLDEIGAAMNATKAGIWPLPLPEPKAEAKPVLSTMPAYGVPSIDAMPSDAELKTAPHSFLAGDIKATGAVGTDSAWMIVKRGDAVPGGFTQSGVISKG